MIPPAENDELAALFQKAVKYAASILRSDEGESVLRTALQSHIVFSPHIAATPPADVLGIEAIIKAGRELAQSADKYPKPIRERAIAFAAERVAKTTDWQEVEVAVYGHDDFGPWFRASTGGDEMRELHEMADIRMEGEEIARERGTMPRGYD